MSIYEYVNISSNERGFKYLKRFEQTWMKSCILFQNSSIRSDLEIRPWRRAVEHYIRSSSLRATISRSRWKKMLNINKSLRAFSLSPTRQRKYCLNKSRLFIAHTFQLVYLLRWKASEESWEMGCRCDPLFKVLIPLDAFRARRLCSINMTKGREIVLRRVGNGSDRSLAYQTIVIRRQTGDPWRTDRLSCSLSHHGIFPSFILVNIPPLPTLPNRPIEN